MSRKPLRALTIVSLESMQSLPFATQLLGLLGARVIKIEPLPSGESGRKSFPRYQVDEAWETGATFARNNLNKESIGLNVADPRGRDLLCELVGRHRIFTHNLRPSSARKLGIDFETLSRELPPIVYLGLSGFGADRPVGGWGDDVSLADWKAFGPIIEAVAGLYEISRPADGAPPRPSPLGALGDIGSGLFAAIAILAAYQDLRDSNVSQYVDLAMIDCMLALNDLSVFYASVGRSDFLSGPDAPGIINAFQADGGYLVLSVLRPNHWEDFCRAIGAEQWLDDPRFATPSDWQARTEDTVRPVFEEWLQGMTPTDATLFLQRRGVPCAPSYRGEQLFTAPFFSHANVFVDLPIPGPVEPARVAPNPIRINGESQDQGGRLPRMGEDTRTILTQELGIAESDLRELIDAGVINTD